MRTASTGRWGSASASGENSASRPRSGISGPATADPTCATASWWSRSATTTGSSASASTAGARLCVWPRRRRQDGSAGNEAFRGPTERRSRRRLRHGASSRGRRIQRWHLRAAVDHRSEVDRLLRQRRGLRGHPRPQRNDEVRMDRLDAPEGHPDRNVRLPVGGVLPASGAGGMPGAPPAPITLEELDQLHRAASPAPWHACRDGECKCKQLWTADHPVAVIEAGEWGDEYPALRMLDVEGTLHGTQTVVEAYTERLRNATEALLTLARTAQKVAYIIRPGRHSL